LFPLKKRKGIGGDEGREGRGERTREKVGKSDRGVFNETGQKEKRRKKGGVLYKKSTSKLKGEKRTELPPLF